VFLKTLLLFYMLTSNVLAEEQLHSSCPSIDLKFLTGSSKIQELACNNLDSVAATSFHQNSFQQCVQKSVKSQVAAIAGIPGYIKSVWKDMNDQYDIAVAKNKGLRWDENLPPFLVYISYPFSGERLTKSGNYIFKTLCAGNGNRSSKEITSCLSNFITEFVKFTKKVSNGCKTIRQAKKEFLANTSNSSNYVNKNEAEKFATFLEQVSTDFPQLMDEILCSIVGDITVGVLFSVGSATALSVGRSMLSLSSKIDKLSDVLTSLSKLDKNYSKSLKGKTHLLNDNYLKRQLKKCIGKSTTHRDCIDVQLYISCHI
jgi:hypothetical protein